MRFFPVAIAVILHVTAVPAPAEVITSEFFSVPEDEGWTLVVREGEVSSWAADGVYFQDFPSNCPVEDTCGTEAFTRSVDAFDGSPTWYYEFRVSATADHEGIVWGAPTVLAAGNSFGELYHTVVASDRIQLLRSTQLPVIFVEVIPGRPHTVRVNLHNSEPPTYEWFIDSVSVDAGLAEDFFPSADARITWQGRSHGQPTLNGWRYIRAGTIPIPASGDFDSNGAADSFEVFYFAECLDRSESGETANPSCSWADMNADNTVDCTDASLFAAIYTGNPTDLNFFQCNPPIPAVSQWGVAVLALLTLTAATLLFDRRRHPLVGSIR